MSLTQHLNVSIYNFVIKLIGFINIKIEFFPILSNEVVILLDDYFNNFNNSREFSI